MNYVKWLAALAILVGVWLNGDRHGQQTEHLARVAEVAKIEQRVAEDKAIAASDALRILKFEQARGDGLAERLLASETSLQTITREKNREIKRVTTGRRCLDSGVLRLLNGGNQSAAAQRVPEAASSAPAEDGAFATDTDVAEWASNARAQYDICRGRLDALINFEEGRP